MSKRVKRRAPEALDLAIVTSDGESKGKEEEGKSWQRKLFQGTDKSKGSSNGDGRQRNEGQRGLAGNGSLDWICAAQ